MSDSNAELAKLVVDYARKHIETYKEAESKIPKSNGIVIGKYCSPLYEGSTEPDESEIFTIVKKDIEKNYPGYLVCDHQSIMGGIQGEQIHVQYHGSKATGSLTLLIDFQKNEMARIPCSEKTNSGSHFKYILLLYPGALPDGGQLLSS